MINYLSPWVNKRSEYLGETFIRYSLLDRNHWISVWYDNGRGWRNAIHRSYFSSAEDAMNSIDEYVVKQGYKLLTQRQWILA